METATRDQLTREKTHFFFKALEILQSYLVLSTVLKMAKSERKLKEKHCFFSYSSLLFLLAMLQGSWFSCAAHASPLLSPTEMMPGVRCFSCHPLARKRRVLVGRLESLWYHVADSSRPFVVDRESFSGVANWIPLGERTIKILSSNFHIFVAAAAVCQALNSAEVSVVEPGGIPRFSIFAIKLFVIKPLI